jgi:hypothetical protein
MRAGMSFTACATPRRCARCRAALLPRAARRASRRAALIQDADARAATAARLLGELAKRGERGFAAADAPRRRPHRPPPHQAGPSAQAAPPAATPAPHGKPPPLVVVDGVEEIAGAKPAARRPEVSTAILRHVGPNAARERQGAMDRPDAMDVERGRDRARRLGPPLLGATASPTGRAARQPGRRARGGAGQAAPTRGSTATASVFARAVPLRRVEEQAVLRRLAP